MRHDILASPSCASWISSLCPHSSTAGFGISHLHLHQPRNFEQLSDDESGRSPRPAAVNAPAVLRYESKGLQYWYYQDCKATPPWTNAYVGSRACRRTKNPGGRLLGPLAFGCSTLPDSQVGWVIESPTRSRTQQMTKTSPFESRWVRVRLRSRTVGSGGGKDLFRYATVEQPLLARQELCCDSWV
jgi:hypothetical protein